VKVPKPSGNLLKVNRESHPGAVMHKARVSADFMRLTRHHQENKDIVIADSNSRPLTSRVSK